MLKAWSWPLLRIFLAHKLSDSTYQGFLESMVLIYQYTIAPIYFLRFISRSTFPMKHLFCSFHSFSFLNSPSSWPLLNLFILSGTLSYLLSLTCQWKSYLSFRPKSNPPPTNVTRYPSSTTNLKLISSPIISEFLSMIKTGRIFGLIWCLIVHVAASFTSVNIWTA